MHLRRQMSLLIITLLVLPLGCIFFFPFFYYIRSSSNPLINNFKTFKKENALMLSERSWNEIHEFIKSKPEDIEIIVFSNWRTVYSNFKELPEKFSVNNEINIHDFYNYLGTTFTRYNYQVQSFYIADDELYITKEAKSNLDETDIDQAGVILTRRTTNQPPKFYKISMKTLAPFYILIITIELVFIIFGIVFTKTVSNSVVRLKQITERIINGDIESPIDTIKDRRDADEFSSLTENLEKMRITLKENKETRSRFIMGVSHDLRTPVALIKGYSEAIEDGVVTGENLINSVHLINKNAIRLEDMINDLINYVKLNSIDWKQNLDSVELKPHLENFLANMRCAAEIYKRSVTGTLDIPDNIMVKMDTNLFQRVIENLFTNALRYTKEGDSIKLNAYINSMNIPVISFIDTGSGIAKKDLDKIFELFYKSSKSRREDGNGIGLAVVKTIIESHGWDIKVKSELKKGTEFIITLNG